jgi:DNA-binding beta-propeller fold protein YncE
VGDVTAVDASVAVDYRHVMRSFGLGIFAIAVGACGGDGTSHTVSASQGRLGGARYSPDGTHLAVVFGSDDKIGSYDLASSTLTELTGGGSYLTGTAWSAAGDTIYYDGTAGIFRIAASGGTATMVNNAFASLGVDLSPDGTRLVYGTNGSAARLYTIATNTETALARPCQAVRFAPSGTIVACISGGALVTIDLATSAETTVIADGLPFIAGLDWYADGQRLIFTSDSGIDAVTVAGARSHLIDAFAAIDLDLAPDDSEVVYGINGQSDLTITGL